MTRPFNRIGVIGGGAWGTALAAVAAAAGRRVSLWAREAEVVARINETHENDLFLPGTALPEGIVADGDPGAVAAAAEVLLLVAPAQFLGAVCREIAPHVGPGMPLVICAKGIEQRTGRLMSEVVAAALPGRPLAVLSGPTFAREVAAGLPTAVTLASADQALGARLVETVGLPTFRPYQGNDVIGTQIGGAVKNVLAIACGIVEGRALGANARAALISRGLAEMLRFGLTKGARGETLMGLSGLGDLVLTCTDRQSRNYSLGVEIGQGRTLDEILKERRSVAEGVTTALALKHVAAELEIEMPLSAAVHAVLHEGAAVEDAIQGLLARPFRHEDATGG